MTSSVAALKTGRYLTAGAKAAKAVSTGRTFMLLRLARFNAVGLALTAVEIIYHWKIKDDALENWCQACTFRKYKHNPILGEPAFPEQEVELQKLHLAIDEVLA